MLNAQFIEEQIKSLPKDKREELMRMLFKKSRQTTAYFHRINDITLSKLEILADFLNLPLDAFRTNPKQTVGNYYGSNNCGNSYYNTNLSQQIEILNKEIELLKKEIEAKEATIQDKMGLIASHKETLEAKEQIISMMRKQIEDYNSLNEIVKSEGQTRLEDE